MTYLMTFMSLKTMTQGREKVHISTAKYAYILERERRKSTENLGLWRHEYVHNRPHEMNMSLHDECPTTFQRQVWRICTSNHGHTGSSPRLPVACVVLLCSRLYA